MAVRELQKLILWAGKGNEVKLEDCQFLIQAEKEKDVWSVTKAVSAKNTKSAVHALNELLQQGGRTTGYYRGCLAKHSTPCIIVKHWITIRSRLRSGQPKPGFRDTG